MIRKVSRWIKKLESIDEKYNWLIIAIYILLISVISAFHEPWFDEAQAWLIARDASLVDILFKIPHYEGHPPLWHLYLAIFAKSGVPYELGIKTAAILINSIAISILVFKAPFSRIIKFTIPFSYYFFYQYGVISRCYSLTMLGFVLLALIWKSRNNKPFATCSAMLLICLSSVYGALFCGGIAFVWLLEIWSGKKIKKFIFTFLKEKRFYALLMLFIVTLCIVFIIYPKENTYASNLSGDFNNFLMRLFYMLVLAPIDSIFFTSIPGEFFLPLIELSPISIIIGIFLFLVFFVVIMIIGRGYKKIKLLIIPYFCFALFSANLYFTEHHIGIITFFLLFWIWVCMSDSDTSYILPNSIKKRFSLDEIISLKKIVRIMPVVCIIISILWSVTASFNEITVNYSVSRQLATFIKNEKLYDKKIMTTWSITELNNEDISNINHQRTPEISAYFENNIFYTFNEGNDEINYNTHIIPTESDIENTFTRIKENGFPDVLIGEYSFMAVFGYDELYENYSLVRIFISSKIIKNYVQVPRQLKVYIRNDLIEEYGLTKLE